MSILKKALATVTVLVIFAALATGCSGDNSGAAGTTPPALESTIPDASTAPATEAATPTVDPAAVTPTVDPAAATPTVDPAASVDPAATVDPAASADPNAAPAGTPIDGSLTLIPGVTITAKGTVTEVPGAEGMKAYSITDDKSNIIALSVSAATGIESIDAEGAATIVEAAKAQFATLEGIETKDGTRKIGDADVKTIVITGTNAGASTYVELMIVKGNMITFAAAGTDAAAVAATADMLNTLVLE